MTTAAICAFGEVSRSPSHYRGEQYDSDLGLYYLRARYYNPATGRFMSRDPKEYKPLESRNEPVDSRKLHKYLYAGADPVNFEDPRGEKLVEYALILSLITEPSAEALEHIEVPIELIFQVAEQDLEIYARDPMWPWWPGSGPL